MRGMIYGHLEKPIKNFMGNAQVASMLSDSCNTQSHWTSVTLVRSHDPIQRNGRGEK